MLKLAPEVAMSCSRVGGSVTDPQTRMAFRSLLHKASPRPRVGSARVMVDRCPRERQTSPWKGPPGVQVAGFGSLGRQG